MKLFSLIFIVISFSCTSNTKEVDNNSDNNSSTSQKSSENVKPSSDPLPKCKLIIKPARTDVSDQFAFQVDSFNAKENDCWEALKQHGISFCQDKFPCRVKYIETDYLGVDKANPGYPDFKTLKKYGIGEFTKFQGPNGWQLAGADEMSWERNAPGFDYFSTK